VAANGTDFRSLIVYSYKNDSVLIEKNIASHSSVVTQIECDVENRFVVSATSNGEIIFWEFFNGSLEIVERFYDPNCSSVIFFQVEELGFGYLH
jgi:hypothetical protein